MHDWAEVGRASVYQALRRLEREGCVSGKEQGGGGGPERRVYRISRVGRNRLRRGLAERFGLGPGGSGEGPLALGLGHLVGREELKRGILEREEALDAARSSIEEDRAR